MTGARRHLLLPLVLLAGVGGRLALAGEERLPRVPESGLEPAVSEQLENMRALAAETLAMNSGEANDRAEIVGEFGRHLQAYGLVESARSAYEVALATAPGDFRWPYHLGVLAQTEGDPAKAVPYFEKALALVPGVSPALVRLARAHAELGESDRAEWLFRETLRSDPAASAAKAGLGELLVEQGRFDEAISSLEQALEEVPDANRLYYNLALAYRGKGDIVRAKELLGLQGPVGIRPADPLIDSIEDLKTGERVHLLRGQQAFRLGRYQDSVDAFRSAVAVNPESVAAMVDLGSALGQLGEVEEAISVLQRAIELAPGNATAHFNVGVLYVQLGRLDNAESHLKQAALLAPADGEIRFELARLLGRASKPEQALIHFRAAIEADTNAVPPRLGEAETLVALSRHFEARARLEEAHQMAPDSGAVAYALGRILVGSPDLAVRDGTKALDLARAVFDARPTLTHAELVGDALAEAGRCEEASDFLAEVLEQAESSGQSPDVLGRLENRTERYSRSPDCRLPGLAALGQTVPRPTPEDPPVRKFAFYSER